MLSELNEFECNEVRYIVERPSARTTVRRSFVFCNKLSEYAEVVRNKERLVDKGFNQEEGIYYDVTFAPVACLESILRMLFFFCILYDNQIILNGRKVCRCKWISTGRSLC